MGELLGRFGCRGEFGKRLCHSWLAVSVSDEVGVCWGFILHLQRSWCDLQAAAFALCRFNPVRLVGLLRISWGFDLALLSLSASVKVSHAGFLGSKGCQPWQVHSAATQSWFKPHSAFPWAELGWELWGWQCEFPSCALKQGAETAEPRNWEGQQESRDFPKSLKFPFRVGSQLFACLSPCV